MNACKPEELLIHTISRLLDGVGHVAVGMASPIPGSGAILRRTLSGGSTRVSILQMQDPPAFTDGGSEVFDMAGQGRIGAFFLSGGQIDGAGNVNLVGIGDYPRSKVRWSGSFGSGYLYFIIPRVILFRWEHSRRTMVEKVDFISAPGTSDPGLHRPGGPYALITNLCLFMFDREAGRFRLESLHPGVSLEEVRDQTGFDFDVAAGLGETETPPDAILQTIRATVAPEIAKVYPKFAEATFDIAADAA